MDMAECYPQEVTVSSSIYLINFFFVLDKVTAKYLQRTGVVT